MKIALVNPLWPASGVSRRPRLPVELGYASILLEGAGHETRMFDGALDRLSNGELADSVAEFRPEMTVVAAVPGYPLVTPGAKRGLPAPRDVLQRLGLRGGFTVAVDPSGVSGARTMIEGFGCDVAVKGECEEALVSLAGARRLADTPAIAFRCELDTAETGALAPVHFAGLPALTWPEAWVKLCKGGAEVEGSRERPHRRRDLRILLREVDGLLAQGVQALWFIDEVFRPWPELLEALRQRQVKFAMRTWPSLWTPETLAQLKAAGCISMRTAPGVAVADVDDLAERRARRDAALKAAVNLP